MAVAEGGSQACAASRVLPCSLVLARSEARRLPDWGTFDTRENFMGKYFIAWLLGVPAVVLVVAYLFFH